MVHILFVHIVYTYCTNSLHVVFLQKQRQEKQKQNHSESWEPTREASP